MKKGFFIHKWHVIIENRYPLDCTIFLLPVIAVRGFKSKRVILAWGKIRIDINRKTVY